MNDLTPTPWLISQLAYDRIRKQLRKDGMNYLEIEKRLDFACRQLIDKSLNEVAASTDFALFLEQVFVGNVCPAY